MRPISWCHSGVLLNGAPNEIALQDKSDTLVVTKQLSGGEIGGLLDARRETLNPAANGLGRLALALADTTNTVHRTGIDLRGDLGGDLFLTSPIDSVGANNNSGTAELAVTVSDLGALTTGDYELSFDASGYQLIRTDTEESVTLSGSGSAVESVYS